MKSKVLIVLAIIAVLGLGYYMFSVKKQAVNTATPTPVAQGDTSPSPYPDTQHAVAAFLAKKYNRPVSEVNVTVTKEVQGFASGSVLFGKGRPGEGGMWLAVLGNSWEVVWDGNGNVDCDKMRQEFSFPDTILKPNFCN